MTPQQTFLNVLLHVVGAPLEAAGYRLEDSPMQQARGLFRFQKSLSHSRVFIEFQMLYHSEFSRFRLNLIRSAEAREEYTLAGLLWNVYHVQVLPSEDHWWQYKQPQDLAQGLYEAGRLLFGYGVPWLEDQFGARSNTTTSPTEA